MLQLQQVEYPFYVDIVVHRIEISTLEIQMLNIPVTGILSEDILYSGFIQQWVYFLVENIIHIVTVVISVGITLSSKSIHIYLIGKMLSLSTSVHITAAEKGMNYRLYIITPIIYLNITDLLFMMLSLTPVISLISLFALTKPTIKSVVNMILIIIYPIIIHINAGAVIAMVIILYSYLDIISY
jgi:hypothetical protein